MVINLLIIFTNFIYVSDQTVYVYSSFRSRPIIPIISLLLYSRLLLDKIP